MRRALLLTLCVALAGCASAPVASGLHAHLHLGTPTNPERSVASSSDMALIRSAVR